jgi:hypothetical protein
MTDVFLIYLLDYTMSFITLELNLNGEYKLIQHESVTIPTFESKQQHMQTYLETTISFKVIFIYLLFAIYVSDYSCFCI